MELETKRVIDKNVEVIDAEYQTQIFGFRRNSREGTRDLRRLSRVYQEEKLARFVSKIGVDCGNPTLFYVPSQRDWGSAQRGCALLNVLHELESELSSTGQAQ